MKDELGGTEFAALRPKMYKYLTDTNNEDKKAKDTKKCVIKGKLKFENYKHCLEETQIQNKINNLEKNKFNFDSFRENQKEFIKNNKLILKSQQSFKSKKHNIFNEKINRIALSANNDKRIQPTDSIGTYAYATNEKIIHKKEEIKCINIIKQYQK